MSAASSPTLARSTRGPLCSHVWVTRSRISHGFLHCLRLNQVGNSRASKGKSKGKRKSFQMRLTLRQAPIAAESAKIKMRKFSSLHDWNFQHAKAEPSAHTSCVWLTELCINFSPTVTTEHARTYARTCARTCAQVYARTAPSACR